MTAPEWRDCADPDELAAAVAAGVEVLAMGRAGDFPTANQTADQFAGSLRAGITYRIPTPTPPWPGAVLSGLVDEDGVPTWLAQAPNVQGESVRTCADFPWFVCGSDNAVTPYWVEVRAPRAVPESETETWAEVVVPADMTPTRLRELARLNADWSAASRDLLRWADELRYAP